MVGQSRWPPDRHDELEGYARAVADFLEGLFGEGREPLVCRAVEEVERQRAAVQRCNHALERVPASSRDFAMRTRRTSPAEKRVGSCPRPGARMPRSS